MPFKQAQIQAAQAIQHAAARDMSPQVRVVAGPGTGKSSAIEERVRWLLAQGIAPQVIRAISFTRASSLDLRQRVFSFCRSQGHPEVTEVRISTLHSLALRTLRAAGLLASYPVDPLVLDNWELESVFDAEFGVATNLGKKRREEIRLEHEAYWSTGQWGNANYIPPDPPISDSERARFVAFHGPRTQSYSCVLPGETVRQCVEALRAAVIDPIELLQLRHLVIDEYQDLNPMDLEFIDALAARGAQLFVVGDDDQSIYSFRFASPAGLQNFTIKYTHCGQHSLTACFRSTPRVLASAQSVIAANPQPGRIPKIHQSLYAGAEPPLTGVVHRWNFASGTAEAQAIAESIRDIIACGLNPRDILVLLNNKRVLLPILSAAFENAGVEYEPPRTETILDSEIGRFVLALMRIVHDVQDYVAHRVLLGLLPGVGIQTCTRITDAVIASNLNYHDIFYHPLPNGLFKGRLLTALNRTRNICTTLQKWTTGDSLNQRAEDILAIITAHFDEDEIRKWLTYTTSAPEGITLGELRDFLWADTDEQQATLIKSVLERLNMPVPEAGVLPPRVRVMTMHGSKGLSGKIVFIPGLEEELLPGPWRRPYPGLVLEAARLLYVSITRSREACIASFARTRIVNGRFEPRTASRFNADLSGAFTQRITGLSAAEIQIIMSELADL